MNLNGSWETALPEGGGNFTDSAPIWGFSTLALVTSPHFPFDSTRIKALCLFYSLSFIPHSALLPAKICGYFLSPLPEAAGAGLVSPPLLQGQGRHIHLLIQRG